MRRGQAETHEEAGNVALIQLDDSALTVTHSISPIMVRVSGIDLDSQGLVTWKLSEHNPCVT